MKVALILGAVGLVVPLAFASDSNVIVPRSSVVRKQDRGVRAHTNHLIYVGPWRYRSIDDPYPLLASSGPFLQGQISGYHPADIRAAYNIKDGRGTDVIAIVDAFDLPTSLTDFNTFSATFGLPVETSTDPTNPANRVFQVVYQNGTKPAANADWGGEIALDIEWAHSMAPNAKIVLFEATDNSTEALFGMEVAAGRFPGVKEVSNSWGGDEFQGEQQLDSNMTAPGVVFFASSGDAAGVQSYPSESPNMVSVGGTHLEMSGGVVTLESAWSTDPFGGGTGGGPSAFELRPPYQDIIQSIVGNVRGDPDISAVADPETGVAVFDAGNWFVFGGTSVACPVCAGIANARGKLTSSTAEELDRVYNRQYAVGSRFWFDVTRGQAGRFSAGAGWDFTTGVGAPRGMFPTAILAMHPATANLFTGTNPSGDASSVQVVDGATFSMVSSQMLAGQTAAGLYDVYFTQPASSMDSVTFDATLTAPRQATVQFIAKNWSTGRFDVVKAWHATGGTQTLSFMLSNSAMAKYLKLAAQDPSGQDHMQVMIRALVPQRFSPTPFTFAVDELDLTGEASS